MKMNEIKSLFPVGSVVTVSRVGGRELTVVGNTGVTVLPANDVQGEFRTIKAVRSKEWVMARADAREIYTNFPKASEVLEARTGLLKFRYDNGLIITICARDLSDTGPYATKEDAETAAELKMTVTALRQDRALDDVV